MTLLPSMVLPTRVDPSRSRLPELLEIAEHLDAEPGWDGVWVPDTILALGFYDATVLLAALAARTRRLRLGVACLSTLGLRQPLVVAQQWANLDQLSEGRMTLVACPGNRTGAKHERERAAFGLSYEEKAERTEEYIGFLRAVSTGDVVSHHSAHIDLDHLDLRPQFRQHPLPIWMVGNPTVQASPEGLRRVLGRVARLGDGWLTYNVRPQELAARLELLTELRTELGARTDASFPVAVQVNLTVAATEEEALDDAAAAWAEQSTRGIGFEDLRAVSAIGTPEQCAAALTRLHDAGATHVLLHPLSADPLAQARRASSWLLPLLPGAGAGHGTVGTAAPGGRR